MYLRTLVLILAAGVVDASSCSYSESCTDHAGIEGSCTSIR